MSSYHPYDVFTPDDSDVPFPHFGRLLPILMLSLLPALGLLYFVSTLGIHLLMIAASVLVLFLIIASSIVIIISGLLGVIERRKYQKLAHPNTHPRPPRYY